MIRPTSAAAADDAMPLATPHLLLPINNNNWNCTGLASNSNVREWLVLCFL